MSLFVSKRTKISLESRLTEGFSRRMLCSLNAFVTEGSFRRMLFSSEVFLSDDSSHLHLRGEVLLSMMAVRRQEYMVNRPGRPIFSHVSFSLAFREPSLIGSLLKLLRLFAVKNTACIPSSLFKTKLPRSTASPIVVWVPSGATLRYDLMRKAEQTGAQRNLI